jgi:hypothetical protein
MIARALRSVPDARAHPGAGSPGRRDRRAIGPPRRGHRPPARAHPRVRCPGRLEQRLSLLRRLADLANRARPGRRPPPGRPAHARGPAASRSARRSCKGPRGAERAEGLHLDARTAMPGLDGRIPRCRLGNRRFAPIGEEAYESVIQKRAEQPMRVAYERRHGDLDPQLVWCGGRAGLERPGCSGPPRHR